MNHCLFREPALWERAPHGHFPDAVVSAVERAGEPGGAARAYDRVLPALAWAS